MNFGRVKTIIAKEWNEVFKNRMVLFTISFMPVLMTILPLGILYGISATTEGISSATADVPPGFLDTCGNLPALDCVQIFMMNQFMLMFMMMPLVIPTAIAAYSIVGEKTTRSLEPLLATPISTEELLTGKALAAALPAIVITWLCYMVFVVLMPLVGAQPGMIRNALGATWLVAIGVIGPLLAVASVNVAIIVSSRVNDPRVAEQVTGIMVVPMMGLLFAQLAGLLIVNSNLMLLMAGLMVLIDAGLIVVGARLFQRETILTRWK